MFPDTLEKVSCSIHAITSKAKLMKYIGKEWSGHRKKKEEKPEKEKRKKNPRIKRKTIQQFENYEGSS